MTPTVLITGAGKRVGKVLALNMAQHGWRVGLHYKSSSEGAEAVATLIQDTGGQAYALQADLADSDQVESLIPHCIEALGTPTCLINNASLFEPDTLQSLTLDGWDAHLNINLKAPIMLSQAFARSLGEQGMGNIINILDQKVWRLTPHYFSYTISKAALWTATQTLAQALAPRIRVNGIGPGPTLPNTRQSWQEFEQQCASLPLERGTTPEEIADAVRFILDAPAMTGQMIALDGGRHLAWQTPDVTSTHD